MTGTESIFYFIEYSELRFKFGSISEDWEDIIKEIVVFATEQVIPFEISKGWRFYLLTTPIESHLPTMDFHHTKKMYLIMTSLRKLFLIARYSLRTKRTEI